MALTFPLPLEQFFDLLPIASLYLDLPESVSVSRTRGGELLQAETGTRLWEGEVRLGLMTAAEAAAVLPLLNLLRGAGRSFMLADPARPFPRLDPAGVQLGAVPVQLAWVEPDRRDITLSGLPTGYRLSRRDLLGFAYGADPVRHALHEVVSASGTAASDGTVSIEVSPPIRPGAGTGTAVTLRRPSCKAIIVPGSFRAGSSRNGGLVEGLSFRVQQTLR